MNTHVSKMMLKPASLNQETLIVLQFWSPSIYQKLRTTFIFQKTQQTQPCTNTGTDS